MESVAWNVAHGLALAGDEIHVIAREAAESEAVEVRHVRVASRWQPRRVSSFSREVAALTGAERFDVVHAFSRTLSQDIYRAGGGCHADYMVRTYSRPGRALRALSPRHRLLLAYERRIFARTPFIQCGSRMVRDEIAFRFGVAPERLRVLQNGVDWNRFASASAAPDLASRRSPDAKAPLWLFAGSGWRRKGLDTALRALASARNTNARLFVAGADEPTAWRALASRLGVADRVDFLGARADIARVYAAADGLLLPSRYDAFANVCLEAAAAGLAIITSGTNGSSELFHEGGGIVAEPEDVAGFADALDRLSDASALAAAGAKARDVARSMTWESHVEKLRELYAEVCT